MGVHCSFGDTQQYVRQGVCAGHNPRNMPLAGPTCISDQYWEVQTGPVTLSHLELQFCLDLVVMKMEAGNIVTMPSTE